LLSGWIGKLIKLQPSRGGVGKPRISEKETAGLPAFYFFAGEYVVKFSENVSCQDTASSQTDRRVSFSHSCLPVVLLILSFFTNFSDNHIMIDQGRIFCLDQCNRAVLSALPAIIPRHFSLIVQGHSFIPAVRADIFSRDFTLLQNKQKSHKQYGVVPSV